MKPSLILRMAHASLGLGVTEAYSRATTPLPGYGLDELQWSFQPPLGKPIFVNGTAQDLQKSLADADILHLNQYNQTLQPMKHDQHRTVADDTIPVKFCGLFTMANSQHISAQVPSIMTISGPAVIGPGPGNCAHVSCSQNSGIWWCNDRNITIMLSQGMGQIGDAVDAIIDKCCSTSQCKKPPDFPVSGQAFSDEGWNVLVRGEDC